MQLNIVDHSKSEEIKNKLLELVVITSEYAVVGKIYEKNRIDLFFKEINCFFEEPTNNKLKNLKLSSALIYWDIVFVLMKNKMNVYADNINEVIESLPNNPDKLENNYKTEFILNYTASFFHLFFNIHLAPDRKRTSIL